MEHLTGVTELDLTSQILAPRCLTFKEKKILSYQSKFGGGFDFILDDYNIIGVNTEFTKLLSTSPQQIIQSKTRDLFQESLDLLVMLQEGLAKTKKKTYALGAEYMYNNFCLKNRIFSRKSRQRE